MRLRLFSLSSSCSHKPVYLTHCVDVLKNQRRCREGKAPSTSLRSLSICLPSFIFRLGALWELACWLLQAGSAECINIRANYPSSIRDLSSPVWYLHSLPTARKISTRTHILMSFSSVWSQFILQELGFKYISLHQIGLISRNGEISGRVY